MASRRFETALKPRRTDNTRHYDEISSTFYLPKKPNQLANGAKKVSWVELSIRMVESHKLAEAGAKLNVLARHFNKQTSVARAKASLPALSSPSITVFRAPDVAQPHATSTVWGASFNLRRMSLQRLTGVLHTGTRSRCASIPTARSKGWKICARRLLGPRQNIPSSRPYSPKREWRSSTCGLWRDSSCVYSRHPQPQDHFDDHDYDQPRATPEPMSFKT